MFKVHNLAVIQLKDTKLGQMTNLKVVFHMVVLFYKFDNIGNSTQFPAQPQSGQYIKIYFTLEFARLSLRS